MRMLGLLVGVLLVAGCGASGSGPAPAADRIVIRNFMFAPMTLTVPPGTRITVSNQDSAAHTVTATDKSFDSGDIAPGATATITAPSRPGTYDYRCDIHQYMTGVLTVTRR